MRRGFSANRGAKRLLPPGPKGRPIVGNLPELRRERLRFLMNLAQDYGDIVHFRLGPRHVYLVNHPDLIKDVLVTQNHCFVKGRGLELARRFLGAGLLTSEGDLHRRQRQLIQPAFHRDRIEAYAQVMVTAAQRMAARWQADEPRDVSQDMMRLTLTIVARCLFDADVEDQAEEVRDALTDLMRLLARNVTTPLTGLLARLPLADNRRFERARARLDAIIYRIIAERRASPDDRGDLLSLLLQARTQDGHKALTDQQVRDEAMTFFLAGHETTAIALTWTWYLLSQHPDAEAMFHAEVDSVLGKRPATVEDLGQLRYTERVFAESLRLYPPAWIIGRRAIADVVIGGYLIPAGSYALVSQYVMHHDPRYFPDPYRFDPLRWTPEAQAARPKFSYFPFGGGPRTCIGEAFAWMEGILLLATLAQTWRLRLVPGHPVELQPLVTLRPRHGMRMIPQRRT